MPAEEIKGVTRDQKKQASLGESEIFGRIINEQLITKIVFNSIHLPLRASKKGSQQMNWTIGIRLIATYLHQLKLDRRQVEDF